jgi:hypothetical protein
VANSGGPSPENKVASAFIEVQTTGVPQVQADLQKVKAATEQATGAQVAGQNKVTAAVQQTGGSFDDLRAALNDSQSPAINLVATLSDLAGVAEKFYEIGKAIRMFIEDSERFARDVERMKAASQGVTTLQGQIQSGSRQYNPEAIKAAGVNPEAIAMMDARLDVIRRQLYGDEGSPGIVAKQTNRNFYDKMMDSMSPVVRTAAGVMGLYDRDRSNEIGQLRREENNLANVRSGIGRRVNEQSYQLDAARIQSQSTPQLMQQLTSTPIASDDAMRSLARACE